MRNKTILITGGSGFIGANLTRTLIQNNTVHLIVRPQSALWRLDGITKKCMIHRNDLLNLDSLNKLIDSIKPEIIYHLASFGNYEFHTDVQKIVLTNTMGTTNLLLALKDHPFTCFVNTGTSSEYGFKNHPMSEDDFLEPYSFYAASKAASSYFSRVYAIQYQKPVVTIRPFSVYGPYEEPRRLIPTIITQILTNHSIRLTPQTTRRDFIHIEDVVDFYIKLPSSMKQIPPGTIFNLGTGKQTSNIQVVKMIEKLLNLKATSTLNHFPNRSWDTKYWVANMDNVQETLHWKATIDCLEGLIKTIEWFKSYKDFDSNYVKKID